MLNKKYFLLIGCLVLLLPNAQANDTCPNIIVTGDQDFWNAHSYMSEQWFRDQFADYYNLHKGDWDEGWGWAKYNDPNPFQYAFPKMMISGELLESGIDDSLSLQGTWSATSRYAGTSTNRRLRAVSRTSDTIDLLYRDSAGNLIHEALSGGAQWYPGSLPSSRVVNNVSDLVRTEKGSYRITGDPFVLSRSADSLEVFARSGNNLYYFSWKATAGWTVENLTISMVRPAQFDGRDRYFIDSDPVAVSRSQDTVDAFAVDDLHHLIHYYWTAFGWQAEDLTQVTNAPVWVKSNPVIAIRSADTLNVFTRGTPKNRAWDKHLVLFSWSSGSTWQAEDLTQRLGSAAEIEGEPAVITRSANEMDVFARKNYHLLHFRWSATEGWALEDLTTVTRVPGSCAGGYCTYVIEGDPVVLNPPTLGSLNVFAHDLNGHLIQYFTDASGWHAENISSQFDCPSIVENPVVFSRSSTRIDIVANNLSGSLTHCYWSPELSWKGESPTLAAAGPLAPNTIEMHPTLVSRRDEALDVFALRLGIPQYYAHYTAAIGLTVNPWHGNVEYSEWAAGSLHHFPYKPTDNDNLAADSTRWIFCSKERVCFGCIGFNGVGPAERASCMLHEATHMNYDDFDHEDNIPGVTGGGCDEPCTDYWIFHGVKDPNGCICGGIGEAGACSFGTGYVISFTHSPYQIQAEYLCDIGEFPSWDVPFSVYNGTTARANTYLTDRILNPPGWSCGQPRPLP